ncbi:MAG: helix-turn-helix transcriptional regulator [Chloroflexi bacterium]|nr:helix-turn-helix transcriptional regulator [Chloroflexota bacterium]
MTQPSVPFLIKHPHAKRPHRRRDPWIDPAVQAALDRVGDQIRDGRNFLSMSQAQLERLSGLDQTAISRLEHGLMPGLRLHRLAAVLAVLDGLRLVDPGRDRNPATR